MEAICRSRCIAVLRDCGTFEPSRPGGGNVAYNVPLNREPSSTLQVTRSNLTGCSKMLIHFTTAFQVHPLVLQCKCLFKALRSNRAYPGMFRRPVSTKLQTALAGPLKRSLQISFVLVPETNNLIMCYRGESSLYEMNSAALFPRKHDHLWHSQTLTRSSGFHGGDT